ncbi:SCP2 domain protein [Natronomonas pharaonis DSM 2160]|uniref:SCP2 domain protein n=1 Tax=Natronomonas pharaonis (strain ATCC 35678 / DSM 2160 / CIP 103997 / JCM 8858 / NBRC 14720 / NCIMB 2260 / Gabara) TaxID=348780 RepID=A0A1U7EUV6_NATPD|nr:SCP2 sterol-binding domain-containing protein [Natronomonas pharaonis]CAI48779.1 SCP2 domain protein [Natronomonas pharaonis DSM 2160]
MSIAFPSEGDEWIEMYGELLDDNDDYTEAGSGWGVGFNGDFVFIIEPDDAYDGDPLYFFLGLEDGSCTDAYQVADPDDEEYGFIFRGPYSNWKRLFQGELGPVDGMMSGEFDIEGDMQKILQYSQAAVEMTETGRDIDTDFEY